MRNILVNTHIKTSYMQSENVVRSDKQIEKEA